MRKTKIQEAEGSLFSGGQVAIVLGLTYFLLRSGAKLLRHSAWMWPLLVTSLVVLGISRYFATRHKLDLQKQRDCAVDSLEEFALYLRPFFADSTILLPNPFWGIDNFGQIGPAEFVGRVLERFIHVREVGGNKLVVGNARAYVADDVWQKVVKEWISKAAIIVILPIVHENTKTNKIHGMSTMWELEYLVRSGRIIHTVVIMPNSAVTLFGKSVGLLDNNKIGWEKAREIATTFGLILPAYENKGAIMTFRQSKGLWIRNEYSAGKHLSQQALAVGLVVAVRSLTKRD